MRPEWLNPAAYPFKAYWFAAHGERLHYLDEGKGTPIVMLHGLGTWSYLFRNQIKELMADHRCLVPDLPGHGFSNSSHKSIDWQKELSLLTDWIEETLSGRFILLGHDRGGLLAQHLADRFAERLDALVLVNTWAWPISQQKIMRRQAFWYRNVLGRWWQGRSNILLKRQLKGGAFREAAQSYLSHYPSQESRLDLADRFAANSRNTDFFQIQKRSSHLPSLVLEGENDPFRSADSQLRWQESLPQTRYHCQQAGDHYLPESSEDFFLQHLRTFLKSIHTPSSNSHA